MNIPDSFAPRIYIVGAGAIGRALAVFLKNEEKDVILVRASTGAVSPTRETITVNLPVGRHLSAQLEVTTLFELQAISGIVLVTAKSNGNAGIAEQLAAKGRDFPVILLQNGLNIEEPFRDEGFTQLFRCVLFVTSQFTTENLISFKPIAPCPVGLIKGHADLLEQTVARIDTPWLRFYPETDIETIIWKKAIVNCVFNSVCPLLNTDNGIFQRDELSMTIARRVIAECTAVANKCGVPLNEGDVVQTLLAISRSSDGQLISTLQDINNKRPTEIATLNLEIARIAAKMGAEHLITETRLLGELTAIKSNLSLAT